MTAVTYLLNPTHVDVKRTIDSLQSYCLAKGFKESQTFELSVCIAEALNNIIEHTFGTARDRNNVIMFSCKFTLDKISMRLKHQAKEFKFSLVEQDDLLALSGRGMFIMQSLLDEIDYKHENGVNEIKMLKCFTRTPK